MIKDFMSYEFSDRNYTSRDNSRRQDENYFSVKAEIDWYRAKCYHILKYRRDKWGRIR